MWWRSASVVPVVLLLTATPLGAEWRFSGLIPSWRPGTEKSAALEVPSPITRDENVENVSLKEAIGIALMNNPGIAAQKLEPIRQREGILGAQSQYDPTLSGEVLYNKLRRPNASALAGTRASRIDDRSANLHLFKLFRTGTQATVDFLNDRLDNNARFSQLRPQYETQLNLSLVQPLLRNFGWDFSYLIVHVAEKQADAAAYQYEAELANFVQQVIEAYWNVVRARETLEVQRESKALADRTVEENEARVRVGLLPPVATLEAQADAKAREEQVLIAENALAVTRQQLAQIAFFRPQATFVPRTLEPVEEVVPEDIPVDADVTLTTALARRPEIEASARDVEAQQLNERIAGNALLPRLDLVGSYGLTGLSGNNRTFGQQFTFFSEVDFSNSAAFPDARCSRRFPGTGFVCTVPVSSPASPFRGDANQAYDRLNEDFRSYSFGVQFEVPFSNAAARGQHSQSRIALSQAELNHRELLSRVTFEARQTVADVTTTRQRIDTTRVGRELAEENLRNQHKRHEVGMATTKDLLDFQTRLTSARAAEVQAKVDFAIAVARWRRAEGQLLAQYQILVERPGKHSPPWFARF